MNNFSIALHGGAGTILRAAMSSEKEREYTSALKAALDAGFNVLKDGGTAIDAVLASTISLEDCPLFNAGKGSVFTHDGKHEMDASVMDGSTLAAGAVACLRNVRNPVLLAKEIMVHSDHVMLLGEGAEEFARIRKMKFEPDEYFYTDFRHKQLLDIVNEERTQLDHSDKKFGTVGAVACDRNGNLAAATSTGGMTNKRYNRIGDSPVIGSGTYANNRTCAISCTGHGEFFLRAVVAYDISCLMEYKGLTLEKACELVVNKKLVDLGGEGGLVAVDGKGNTSLVFNSEGMYGASKSSAGIETVLIYR